MITLRRAGIEDAPAVAAVHALAHRETYMPIVGEAYGAPSEAARLAFWTEVLALRESRAHLALDENKAIGFAHASAQRITALYVLASHHRRGVGRRLLFDVLADMRAAGYDEARFEVFGRNQAAIAFYERQGARFVRRRHVDDEDGSGPFTEHVYSIATGGG
ncbi:GNAT family N-acetyltransferase [Marinivivus vitaminiproducens]|uniref:GNAT family N-acetyltransferase n=1 Tax=Marinivivus vitaminiproducens TaxID=3035935 RepID=UPI0027A35EA3|nr:GNAT family N-acetyltransferase [Geminicoccaceae bacterium SCSIO 64248]